MVFLISGGASEEDMYLPERESGVEVRHGIIVTGQSIGRIES